MRTYLDRLMSVCVVTFGLPLIFIGRGQWDIGILGAVVFLLLYSFLPFCKSLRAGIKILNIFVLGSYFVVILGCWFIYSNSFDNAISIWLYIFVAIAGFPVFKKVQAHLKSKIVVAD